MQRLNASAEVTAPVRSGRQPAFLVGAVVVVLGAGSAFVVHAQRRADERTRRELESVRAELARLERAGPSERALRMAAQSSEQVRVALERVRAQDSARPAAEPAGEVAAPEVEELSPQEREARAKEYNESRIVLYESAHAGEVRDRAWADTAAKTLHDAFPSEVFPGLEVNTDCRSTLCRIDFAYDGRGGQDTGQQILATHSPWPGRRFCRMDHEKKEGSCYLSREGSPLPALDALGPGPT